MKFNESKYKADQESRLPEPSDYKFKVLSAEKKTSQAGNDMIALKLAVFDKQDKKHTAKDWLGEWEGGSIKIKSFLEAVQWDLSKEYEASDLVNLTGIVHTKNGEFNGQPQVQVRWYVPAVPGQKVVAPSSKQEIADDDIPF